MKILSTTATLGARADDSQTYRADDRGFTEDPETGLVRRETFDESRGEEVTMAPNPRQDALSDLIALKPRILASVPSFLVYWAAESPTQLTLQKKH